MEHNEYDIRAEEFLTKFGFEFKAAFKGDKCPPWDDEKHIHGDRYRVTLRRKSDRKSISFDFWNSYSDSQKDIALRAYDVLSSLSGDINFPDDPDELISELGPMPVKQALATVRFTKRLNAFFTEEEREALSEIS